MALRVKVAARAAKEVRDAAEWWALNRPAAPGAVRTDFGEAVSLLTEQPGIGAKYLGARTPGVRRLFLSRLHYFVYYKVEGESLHYWRSGTLVANTSLRYERVGA